MFSRKLKALKYHSPNSFDISDERQFRNCVVWLEDKLIRLCTIEDREPLRQTTHPEWNAIFNQYLQDLHAPVASDDNAAVLSWLLSYAVRLEYKTKADDINQQLSTKSASKTALPAAENPDALCNLTAENETLKAGIKSLADTLSVPHQEDHILVLEALKILIENQLSAEAIAQAKSEQEPAEKKSTGRLERSLKDVSLGFDIKDPVIRDAAKIIRLLHIKELRQVQTKVNQAIVSVQRITANPVTDQSLGRVGR